MSEPNLAARRAQLTPAKRELLAELIRSGGARPADGIRRRAESGPAPLSFAQQRLWFLDRLFPGSPAYNILVPLRMEGRLDSRIFEEVLTELVRRHESLRTTFEDLGGEPVQQIHPPARLPVSLVDLRALPASARQGETLRLGREEAGRGFDLERGPLLRARLLCLRAEEHVLLANMHHIVSDGWSAGIMAREVSLLYAAFRQGRPSPLPELSIQYADFAVWQRRRLAGEILEAHLSYWRRHLEGLPAVLELPTDRPRSATRGDRGAMAPIALGRELSAALAALCRQENVTPFITFLAAFEVLLSRCSGQELFGVGTPIAGRTQVEIEPLIGFFVNTLVQRADLSGEPTFREVLEKVRKETLGTLAHQELPFEKMVEGLGIERSLSHTPLFQVMFTFQNAPEAPLELSSLRLRPLEVDTEIAKFDLGLTLGEGPGGFGGGLEHSIDLFDRTTAQRLAESFRTLLEALVTDPGRGIWDLPLLSPAESHQLQVEWKDMRDSLDHHESVHTLVEAQVERTPERVAVVCAGESLTYLELNRRANRLAHRLRRLGVGPEVLVGIYLERSLDLVVMILGVLKAGGAYVPLDPELPRDRLVFMVEDAGVQIVVGEQETAAVFPEAVRLIRLDIHRELPERLPPEDLEALADRASLAYVIYTSGSTGRPKGVLVSHGNVVRLFATTQEQIGFGERDVWTLFHSCAFDFSVWEIWGALLYGGRLVIVPFDVSRSPELFLDLLIRERVTVLNQTPSAFAQLARVDEERGGASTDLRRVVFGGEALDPVSLLPWFARHGDERPLLVNMYGITETTVHVTFRPLRTVDARGERRSLIGRPIPDLSLSIVDPGLRPVPIGVPGELVIGGAGLARGYLGRPELTAERFVPDPDGSHPGARLYRSGDLGRFLTHGDVEYLGRIDHQVKVRGFRIELGEIEAALAALDGVREAVVVAREDRSERGPGDRRLVAYVVGDVAGIAADALRLSLRERLPDYMMPAVFVILGALPLTPNGKVDRKALPAPEWSSPASSYVAPGDPMEELLAEIWAEVLGIDRVGVQDDFFALGGHSLMATKVVSRVRQVFGVDLAVRVIFETPVLADQAVWIRRLRGAEPVTESSLVPVPHGSTIPRLIAFSPPTAPRMPAVSERNLPARRTQLTSAKRELLAELIRSGGVQPVDGIRRRAESGPAPLSFAQQRLWFLYRLFPVSPAYNILVPLRVEGRLDSRIFAGVLTELVRRHESLRTTFAEIAGEPVQRIHPASAVAVPLVDLQGLAEAVREGEALRLGREEAGRGFDLEQGPLLCARLLRLGSEEHILLANMHHIVSDGWSAGILAREVSLLYASFRQGHPSSLPELPIQYADFAVWQRQRLQGEVLEGQLSYWRRRLADLPAVLELPTDRPRPAIQGDRGAVTPVLLGRALSVDLAALGRRAKVTPFMTLLAAFEILLGRFAAQEIFGVGTPIAGRNRAETEPLIGFFVNTLVLRADLSGEPTFEEVLQRVREEALDSHTYQELPFEKLVEHLGIERSLSHTPLFQEMFTFQNAPEASLELPGLRLLPLGIESEIAQFDLSLTLREGAGGFGGGLEHRTDLFDRTTVQRLAGHFETLLATLVADPGREIWELPLLSLSESHQVLVEWNDTKALLDPRGECAHALFETQVERAPERIAVVFEGESLSYGELDGRANRLAHRLRRLGVGPEARVGIYLERSLELVVVVLAVLKAGGGWVPLDPEDPHDRVSLMVRDSGMALLLSRSDLAAGLAPLQIRRVDLDQDDPGLPEEAGPSPESGVISDHLMYVIYTSGSTGRPKGVMVPHRGVTNRLLWGAERYPVTAEDCVLFKAAFSFDASVWELLTPLISGARLVVARPGGQRDPAYLVRTLREQKVTMIDIGPSMLRALLAEEGIESCGSLRSVSASGEALSPELAALFFQKLGGVLRNQYGPTEASIDVMEWICPREEPLGRSVPLGRPHSNVSAHVLDRRGLACPIGVPGELHLGGVALARGYLGRPELTAEKLVPDPFGAPGSRLYRTGDLARHLADGRLEFLGRIDHQVKLRGFRIELGEIEAVLRSYPGVRQAVVVLREDLPGDRRLVAYLVTAEGEGVAPRWREWLAERLPDFMIPAAFVSLEVLPLTASGKVDRRALPAPEWSSTDSYVAPGDLVEELLAGIWAEVLRIDRVGVRDDFFTLGGHSLLATQVVSRVRQVLDVDLPVRTIFEAPVLADQAAQIRQLRRAEPPAAELPLVPVPREGRLPLSFAQQRLWFLDRLLPGSPAYNIPAAFRAEGQLDPRIVERVLTELVRRHEILRTTFEEIAGEPVQRIRPASPLPVPLVDLQGLAATVREEEALRLGREEAGRSFDLEQDCLLRVRLLRLGSEEHILLVNMHHIVSDGWSAGIMAREVSVLYAAFRQGRPSPLPDLSIQYADFAVWQRQRLMGELLEDQLSHWRRHLADLPAVLELPTDRPRPAVRADRGAVTPVLLGRELSADLAALGRREQVTPFMTLLAVFEVLLGRFAAQEIFGVGTPVAGRDRVDIEPLIGFFVNTLIQRADLSGEPTSREMLGRVRKEALDSLVHQELPFEKMVEELGIERRLSHTPLFQVMFTFQNAPEAPLEFPGLRLLPLRVDSEITKFDLSLTLGEGLGGFGGGLGHSTDLFDRTTAQRLVESLRTLLEALVADPGRRIWNLPLLSPPESHQVLVEWNDTRAWLNPRGECVHTLIEAQVGRTPERIAVAFERENLSYGELNRRANRLAHRLRRLGVGPEILVGVCLERSLELAVVLLAVLKAGGAYVPLDPEYPRDRLIFMVEDSRARVLITRRKVVEDLRCSALRLDLDSGEQEAPAEADAALPGGATADNLAYVIYTSGSTGRPKGVLVSHCAVVNRLLWAQHCYPVTVQDCVLHKASVSFDFSVWECFAPLLTGARLVMASPGGHRETSYLVRTIQEQEVTFVHFVPSMLRAFLAEEGLEACASLHAVFSGGEALPAELERLFFQRLGARLRNQYGPTETAIDSTHWLCGPEPSGSSVPIGRPIDNTKIYVLDQRGRPSALGVPGELHIGGVGVGRGYLGGPALTGEKFVPDSFGGEPGARLYRTGDLVRQRPDGRLEFLGRIDHQVKVRGFRIELGEIESVLRSHPGVVQAVVVVREDLPGHSRLVAYVVPADRGAAAPRWREWLSERLPEFMLPTAFVTLEALPLSPAGKLDRHALPAPAWSSQESHVALADQVEELLAGIWMEVLGLERVGARDDFFALGGHSLLATQVVSRVRRVLGVDLPVRAIFEFPILADQAAQVRRLRNTEPAPELPLLPVPREGPLPLSFAQQRLWFLHRLFPGSPAYNILVPLRMEGRLDSRIFAEVLTELVRRHESLRTTFEEVAGEPVQRIHPASAVPLPLVDLRGLAEAVREGEALRLGREEAGRSFDLGQGPLLRVRLLRLGNEEHILLVNMHHIVSDGWSAGIVAREVSLLYTAFRQGHPSPLPELPIQYADFAVWQRRWLGEVLEDQVSHWRRRLADLPAVLELPTDRPRPAIQGDRGAVTPVLLGPKLSADLAAFGRRQQVTPFMTLLMAFEVLLGRLAAQEVFGVGTPIAGRNRVETEPLIGFFVNTLVLRADLSGEPTFEEVLQRVREEALDAHAHQELPFEKLVEHLGIERSLSHAPLFQEMFTFQNAPEASLELPGLRLLPLGIESEIAQFDLSLTLREGAGGFGGGLEHRTDLFDRTTVQRLAGHFETLLATLVADPGRKIWDHPLLAPAESHQVLVEWNDTKALLDPRGECVHALFESQVERAPERIAVVFEGESLSYRELDGRANRLAHRLRRMGVGPDVRVGIYLERSLELVVAVLAVLKAGGGWVPLDPEDPHDRVSLMVRDSGMTLLLSRSDLAAGLAPLQVRQVDLDRDDPGLLEGADASPASGAMPDHLMYVIYTSGSTGRPKGVMVPHRGVTNRLLWGAERYPVTAEDCVLFKAAFSFDASVWELLTPLISGARLVVARPGGQRDPAYLVRTLREQKVTMIDIGPSMLRALLAEEEIESCGSLRSVSASGEALSPELAALFFQKLDGVLRNQYGPTEASIDVTEWICPREEPLGRSVPLGRPHSNVSAHVLDRRGLACPIGVPGELHLGGVALARGYLGRPELTAEKLVPDPFDAPGSRLYRTGDLARHLADGRLEFLGRIDHQVKLRGFRIELGEIEAVLRSHPGIRQAVVVMREDLPGDRRLVAYLVTAEGEGAAPRWREWLAERLPDFMIPAAFVSLEAFPLTASGKVDRRALPAPEWSSTDSYVAPGDLVEELLAGIWAEVLGIDRVGVRDDFFTLGGHSLTAVLLMARVRVRFGRELPIVSLFQHPTVETMAGLLRSGVAPAPLSPLVPIQREGVGRPFYCVHPVGGTVACYAELARLMGTSRPFFGLQAMVEGGEPQALQEMASTYLHAIRAEQPHGPYLLGGWSLGGLIAVEMTRQLESAGERAALLALLDPTPPGAVTEAPDPAQLVLEFARDLIGLQGGVLGDLEVIEGESRGEAALRLFDRLRAQGIIPPGLEPAALEDQLEVFYRNLTAVIGYRPQPITSRVALITPQASSGDRIVIWRELASGGLETHRCGGDHYSLLRPPHVEGLAAILRSALDTADLSSPPLS